MRKETLQYASALAMIASGIILAFLSFFKNEGDIAEGVLWYVAQALTYAGGVFGVSVYFKSKLGDFESRVRQSPDMRETQTDFQARYHEHIHREETGAARGGTDCGVSRREE